MLGYLRLIRLPNAFTAVADVAAAFVIARFVFSGGSWWPLVLLACASACLYLAGIAFNDIADREVDARSRPTRPLPSGAVSLKGALYCGAGLWLAGLCATWAAGLPAWRSGATLYSWAPLSWGLFLGLAVLLYDFSAKNHALLGPASLGLCRFLNFQLGLTAAPGFVANLGEPGLAATLYAPALAVGLYAAGLTAFSPQEEGGFRPAALAGGWAGVAAGLVVAALAAPQWPVYPGLIALALALALCTALLVRRRTTTDAGRLVRVGVLGICLLDASLVLGHGGSGAWRYAAVIVALLLPALLVSRWLGQREA